MKKLIHLFAFGFGSGLAPIMPGTCGAIIAIPIYLLLSQLNLPYYLLSLIIMTIFGVWICGVTAHDLNQHDPKSIVWDEVVGYLVTMTALPLSWIWISAGFIIFRLFDIWKPWPICVIDKKVQNGLGIMLDDILAAIFAGVILHLIKYIPKAIGF
ncbi:MAG: phosphatidylglycerophosphatase A [Gammaproteobacteria bacterium]|nr:phosphatidylglycerophosphatase A [Gammaproteobacteria bacterium]